MSKKRSDRFQPLVRIAESRERDAARMLGEQQRRVAEQQDKLTQLLGYREDYTRQFHEAGAAGMRVAQMHEFRALLVNLDRVIEEQRKVLAQAQDALEAKRRQWLDTRTRTQVFDTVVERYRDEESRDAARREQKELDERAQRPRDRGGD